MPQINLVKTQQLDRNLKQINFDLNEIRVFCLRNPIQKLSLFGSVLRNDFTVESDVDFLLLLEKESRVGYFKLVRMENELTDLIGRKADLRTAEELSRYFRQEVINEAILLYAMD